MGRTGPIGFVLRGSAMTRTPSGRRCRVLKCSPEFQVRAEFPMTIEDNIMTKLLTRLAFGLWIVGAPMMLVGRGGEDSKPAAPAAPEAAKPAAPAAPEAAKAK
jgi:hypothetical protein